MGKRILSGIQPTSHMHLGNYLGAVRNWVKMQDEGECLYMIADLHAITVPYDAAGLTGATREMVATMVAAGIDPDKSAIFAQSNVPGHSELMWLLAHGQAYSFRHSADQSHASRELSWGGAELGEDAG